MNNKQIVITVGIIAALLAAGATWLLWQGDQQVVLSSDSRDRQAGLEAVLTENGIAYTLDEENRVIVGGEDLFLARALADQASLTVAERSGFEIFEDEDYGATQFVQRINYQRALQAELERTIIGMTGVRDARVHIRQPAQSSFFQRERTSRAAVVLDLSSGIELQSVAPSITELLTGAVDDLDPADVRVISGSGSVFARSDGGGAGGALGLTAEEQLENKLAETVYEVLAPIFPRDAIGVSVSVELDRSSRSVRRESTPTTNTDSAEATALAARESVSEEIAIPPGDIRRIGVGIVIPETTSAETILEIELLLQSGLALSTERGDVLSVMAYSPPVEETVSASAAPPESLPIRSASVMTPVYQSVMTASQFNAVLIVCLIALIGTLTIRQISRRRRERQVVHQVSQWIKEPAE